MRAFADAYPHFSIVQELPAQIGSYTEMQKMQAPLAQISWYHHTTLLDKVKNEDERQFYIQKAIENGWSRNVMVAQIESKLHERQGKAIHNFKETLPAIQSDLAHETLKNPYNLEFLGLTEEIRELELEKALIHRLKDFMLELGKGFAYVGRQKNLEVEGDDFFLDLLFYNYQMHCFMVIELKVDDFKPEYVGKLNFYVNVVNEQLRGKDDAPTIGILLCKTPNNTVVKYSLQNTQAPIGISEYQLAEALPNELQSEIPSVDELEAEIDKEYEELKSPNDKRWNNIKERLANLNQPKLEERKSDQKVKVLIENSLVPLIREMWGVAQSFKDDFMHLEFTWYGIEHKTKEIEEVKKCWLQEDPKNNSYGFKIWLHGFKPAGVNAFDLHHELQFDFDRFWYTLTPKYLQLDSPYNPLLKKLYTQDLNHLEIKKIAENFKSMILDQIDLNVKQLEE